MEAVNVLCTCDVSVEGSLRRGSCKRPVRSLAMVVLEGTGLYRIQQGYFNGAMSYMTSQTHGSFHHDMDTENTKKETDVESSKNC
jgi:hypothetical protein